MTNGPRHEHAPDDAPDAPDAPDALAVDWLGARFVLLGGRALWWPARDALLIADPHFGKSATFRAHGIPLPHGDTTDDVARLDALVHRTGARRLLVLGDFYHARTGRAVAVEDALVRWRAAHASLGITLVRGNHDRHAGDPPESLRIACVAEPLVEAGVALRHHPIEVPASEGMPVVAGHLHPVAVLSDATGLRHRLPCFHLGTRQLVLPAFGSFTGGHPVRPAAGDRVVVIGERGELAEVATSSRPRGSARRSR